MSFFPKIENKTANKTDEVGYVSSDRSSLPDYPGFLDRAKDSIEIKPDFNIEMLRVMENYAVSNESFSQALDNIVQLGNTEHDIIFSNNVSDSLQRELLDVIDDVENRWYEFGEGVSSLKGDLLTQVAINGCLSAESVPDSRKLYGIDNIVRVRPKNIRFVYNPKTTKHDPYQRLGYTNKGVNGLRPLNTRTYTYIALRRYFESPYPTPPFLSAMRSIVIKESMLDNFENIMKMMGILGIVTVKVKKPQKMPGENETAYLSRCFNHLKGNVNPEVKKMLSSGFVSGFIGDSEFAVNGAGNSAKGANEMMKLIDLTIMAGLKQDPNMNGLNFATTETFGKIIMEKMMSQVGEYQTVTDGFFKKNYKLELLLKGYDSTLIKGVKSKQPKVKDEKSKAEAAEINQRVWLGDYKQGLIDQQTLAQLRGYDKPAFDGPQNQGDESGKTPSKGKETEDEPEEDSNKFDPRLNIKTEYQYDIPHRCGGDESFASILPKKKAKLYGQYLSESQKAFENAVNSVSESVESALQSMRSDSSKSQIANAVYSAVINNWTTAYIVHQDQITSYYVTELWDKFRRDKSVFGEKGDSFASLKDIPDAVFDLDDFRAIQYFIDSDQLYLGKFINDKGTKAKLYKFIFDEYVNGTLPIGEDPMGEFSKRFKNILKGEGYKVSRIIDTTTNRIRNNSAVYYMKQANVESYRINEIVDNLTCEHCSVMDGKKFDVGKTQEKLANIMQTDPQSVATQNPFATSIDIKDFREMTTEEIEKAGIDVPVYHPKCRGFVSAVL